MKTINQINGQVAANSTIQFYLGLSDSYNRYENKWQNRYFTFKLPNYNEGTRLTPSGNFIYGAALKEFSLITTGKTDYNYHYSRDNRQAHLDIQWEGYLLQFQIRIKQGLTGVFLSLETNFQAIQNYNNSYSLLKHTASQHKVRSNSTFQELDIVKYFEQNVLKQYLFAPGLFRNIQIMRNCTKSEAIAFYNAHVKMSRQTREVDTWETEIEKTKAIVRQIRRSLNIQICGDFTDRTLLNILSKYKRQKTLTKLFRQPSIFELSELYNQEHDTEENIEQFINEHFEGEYPKNAIFI